MKVLWICNLILPEIAENMGLGVIPKEGWVKGLLDAVLQEKGMKNAQGEQDFTLAIAFPVNASVIDSSSNTGSGFISGKTTLRDFPEFEVEYYGFYEDTAHESLYEDALEERLSSIFESAKPDVIHCFGTEFPHTLAAARVWNKPDRMLIGIQGLCTVCAERYSAHMPEEIVNRHTFRDWLKKDSIKEQRDKYTVRGNNERAAVKLAGHIAGRTAFDKSYTNKWNDSAEYHYLGENLRKEFYSGEWDRAASETHRIFVSQADYPIKGFHILLMAVGEILRDASLKEYHDINIYVAGQSIVDVDSLKKRIKISSYGKYLNSLIEINRIDDRIHILGRLSAEQMKEQYMKCDTYVCCSVCENSPNSLGEAMMLKVPVVTSEVGGITSVFEVGKDGYSYRDDAEDSIEEVVEALKKALIERWTASDVDIRRECAYQHAYRNHNPKINAERVLEIYSKMVM